MKNTSLCLLLSLLFFAFFSHSLAFAEERLNPLFADNLNDLRKHAKSKVVLMNGGQRDQSLVYLGGTKGILLCFHGTGGEAAGWFKDNEKMNYLIEFKNNGFSFICPTSYKSKWSETDFERVNKLLNELGIDKNQALTFVGHSNGAAFTTRYALLRNTVAVHLANSKGIKTLLHNPFWKYKTFVTYAKCDKIVDYKKVEEIYYGLRSPKKAFVMDQIYEYKKDTACHTFINTAKFYLEFINNKPTYN